MPLLTPEYFAGIPTFTRRYFEELFSRLPLTGAPKRVITPSSSYLKRGCRRKGNKGKGAFYIVLDNYQEVPADSPFHETIASGVDVIPDGVRIIVISRGDPPSAMARLQANDRINLLDHRDIGFSFQEAKDLVLRRIPKMDNKCIKAIHQKTEGWAAGIILMLERTIQGNENDSAVDLEYDRVFEYFAGEIFNKTEKEVRDFLLKTAFLPMLSVPLAEKLTGDVMAGRILSSLSRQHYFTERLAGGGQDYQYHPLFRDFLCSRAETVFSTEALSAIRRNAARLLERSGQIEDAARLYCDAGDGAGLGRMVIHHARALLVQGRSRTVEEWLACIPGDIVDEHPWLLYWRGMCSFPSDMPRARKYLERAFDSFRANGDVSGIYLSWAGIVDTYALGLDEWKPLDAWIAVFDKLRKTYRSFPTREIDLIVSSRMLISLTLRKTDQPKRVERWLQRVSGLLHESPSFDIQMDTIFTMSVYYLWKGEYDRNAVMLERAAAEIDRHKPAPFTVIRIKLMKGIHCWITARYEAALQTLREGLDISQKSGVHVFDSLLWSFRAAAEMAPGNMEAAAKSLKNQMTSLPGMASTLDIFFYHINAAWHAILSGNPSPAAEHMTAIAPKVAKMGTPYYRALWNIGMAQVAFMQGRKKEARTHIRTAHQISLNMKSQVMEWYSLLVQAYFLLEEGKEKEGLPLLRAGLSLARKYGYVHLEFYQPSVMQLLCAKALERGIETDYLKGLIRKLGLTPPDISLQNWPYPVRIRTLGRFEIMMDDRPLVFTGKVPKKPLELLKALIAFGSVNVRVNTITDALWPEAEGDAAYSSFRVTLHTLRKLLGSDRAVLSGEERVSLNPEYCYLDLLAFQHLAEEVMSLKAGSGKAETMQLLLLAERSADIYKGNFMEGEDGHPYVVALRERTRSGFVRIVDAAGKSYEDQGQWQKAAALYDRGLAVDELQEEFYRRLMLCLGKVGRYSEAASVYDRCRRMLHSNFGVEPSAATRAVFENLTPP